MLAGPIFARELMTGARRHGTYVRRTVIALLLVIALGANYYGWEAWTEGKYGIDDLVWFARTAFCSLVALQGILTVLIVPTQVGTAIAEEKERKTLHYLMCSDLSASEIVLGKLTTNLLQYVAGLSAGLPVLMLLTLMGGVDPRWVFLAYGGTLSTAYLIGALAILMSVLARRPRTAVNATLGITAIWLVGSVFLTVLGWTGVIPQALRPTTTFINEWVLASSPLTIALKGRSLVSAGSSALVEEVAWMSGLQLAAGTVLIALAVSVLRPVFRAQEGSAGRDGNAKQRRRRHRPACGDQPVLWKECYPPRLGRVARVFTYGMIIAMIGGFTYATLGFAIPLFSRMVAGSPDPQSITMLREPFLMYLRVTTGLLFCLYGLMVLSGASCSISSERERDTWDSLMTTPLTHREIVIGKMRGAVWQQRWYLWLLGFMWAAGLCTRTLHPLSLLAVVLELVVYTWFVAVLGVWASLVGKNTSQAASLGAGVLLVLNLISVLTAASFRSETMLACITCMPILLAVSVFSPLDLQKAWGPEAATMLNNAGEGPGTVLFVVLTGFLLYTLGAVAVTFVTFRVFDRTVGRPRRAGDDQAPGERLPHLGPVLLPSEA